MGYPRAARLLGILHHRGAGASGTRECARKIERNGEVRSVGGNNGRAVGSATTVSTHGGDQDGVALREWALLVFGVATVGAMLY